LDSARIGSPFYSAVYAIKFTRRLEPLRKTTGMGTIRNFWTDMTGASAVEDGSGAEHAKAEIAAAVRYLLNNAAGEARGQIVREIVDIVHAVANGPLAIHDPKSPDTRTKQPVVSSVTYKAYFIDAFQRDRDNWRATVRRLDGKKLRASVPPLVRDDFTTSSDALTAEKAINFARSAIDAGEFM